ncbi:eggshell protein-like [Mytilus trossulus]|uniref:eggshell protein-like n=1 Tax=Mytilus trossulus TaxID=6551 RepID=UPI00300506AF
MLSSVVVTTLFACVSATFYKGSFEPQSGYQRFVGYGPMNSNFGMMGYGNQNDMFNDGYLNVGVGGFQNRGLMGGYQKGGLGGYFKGGMGGQFNGGNIGHYKGIMDFGFEGWNNHDDGFGMGNQDFGSYPIFLNNGLGNMGGAYGIKGFKTGSY